MTTGAVSALWRHPIKSHGREALDKIALDAGGCVPWDRHWAVSHDASGYTPGSGWGECMNFMIGTRTPGLAGIWASLDEATARITLRHTDLGEITFSPETPEEARQFLAWVAPLIPENRAQPKDVVRIDGRGMTDTDYPSVSLANASSHRAVSQKLGREIAQERWRCNIWMDGLAPWEEFDWIGRHVRVGSVEFKVQEPIERCLHTSANPKTGKRDADTLGTLRDGWGHQNFGIYATVVKGGEIRHGDPVEPI